ncbi:hypothetical protein AVEN_32225-1 [Araneus ventricosus]|uniref:Uncharacterized protein n=1 Tax=Araneus ventricosus TaxID=182803 RepID=A0A4Y2LL27_ARAVE|nr:hypothetical protein AVEN_32225-1 [Araneus ventricosus]
MLVLHSTFSMGRNLEKVHQPQPLDQFRYFFISYGSGYNVDICHQWSFAHPPPSIFPERNNKIILYSTFSMGRRGRGGIVARSGLLGRRHRGSKPDSIEDLPCMALLHAKSYVVANRPPVGVAWKLGERVPPQVSSLSSDRGSKIALVVLQSRTLI